MGKNSLFGQLRQFSRSTHLHGQKRFQSLTGTDNSVFNGATNVVNAPQQQQLRNLSLENNQKGATSSVDSLFHKDAPTTTTTLNTNGSADKGRPFSTAVAPAQVDVQVDLGKEWTDSCSKHTIWS